MKEPPDEDMPEGWQDELSACQPHPNTRSKPYSPQANHFPANTQKH